MELSFSPIRCKFLKSRNKVSFLLAPMPRTVPGIEEVLVSEWVHEWMSQSSQHKAS